jgi:hypothetical protein
MGWKEKFSKVEKDKRKETFKLILFQFIFFLILIVLLKFYNKSEHTSLIYFDPFWLDLIIYVIAMLTLSALTAIGSFFNIWAYFGFLVISGGVFSLPFIFSSFGSESIFLAIVMLLLVLVNFITIPNFIFFRWISRKDFSYTKKLAILIVLPVLLFFVFFILLKKMPF